ncbi:tRNA (adenine(58)-N(1))-methyltransferase catalytic subunit TRMT61A isoform X2 [Periplaneta americana]|uniref:tRNA (adenine(58)-N(1))-methyltransferase catalytic subunit TRMT61A isoform X2 n=1 Tax=Periplaneta americana TaxID=6978 RepID=UPI0037E8DE59
MSFEKFKDVIEQGDTVILYLSVNNMHAIQVQPKIKNKKDEWVENVFQTMYGALKVQSLVGKKFGTKVALSRGWAYVLHPTPELWTLTLPHRTQIIYTPDISMIIFQLEIRPGSVVIESGTGSGSLSHALIRCIKPLGHLYTFDFHEYRVSVVREEFEAHGIGQFVTVEQRDVCQNGFGTELNGKADAVFLDLPHPWEAVPHAAAAIKDSGGRFVSFSPCIEQVQRTCEALSQHGFMELATTECLQKELQVQTRNMPILQLDFLKQKSVEVKDPAAENPEASTSEKQGRGAWKSNSNREMSRFVTGMPPQTMTGHTGYLTAATLPPIWARVTRPSDPPTSSHQGQPNEILES